MELSRSGVEALSEGMNGRMLPVNVPPAFLWKNGNVTMPTLWHWHGYGSFGDPGDPIRIPGSTHAFGVRISRIFLLHSSSSRIVHLEDTHGEVITRVLPLSADEVLDNMDKARSFYSPYVNVISSTFGDFVESVREEKAWEKLPVITRDLSDSWIWGVASDPVKTQRMRSIARARTDCEMSESSFCSENDEEYYNFSRLAIKNMEHTWGMSVFHYGNESDVDWSNAAFHDKLSKNQSNFVEFIESWKEQREIAIDIPMTALSKNHELRKHLETDFEDLSTYDVSLVNMSLTSNMNDLSLGSFTVSIANDGSIVKLIRSNNVSLVSSEHPLGLFRYQTIVKSQLDTWRSEYLIPGSGGYNEYGMPDSFMNGTNLTAYLESGRVRSVYVSSSQGQDSGQPRFREFGFARKVRCPTNLLDSLCSEPRSERHDRGTLDSTEQNCNTST